MAKHAFWGDVREDWAGFSSEVLYTPRQFPGSSVTVFLGGQFDEEGEEVEAPPSRSELDQYQSTYNSFIASEDRIFVEIREACFSRYLKLYAHHYEDRARSGAAPLNIHSKERHFEFVRGIKFIRLLARDGVVISFDYALDTEHGLEVRLEANRVAAIGVIAETSL